MFTGSYGFNGWLFSSSFGTGGPSPSAPWRRVVNVSSVRAPAGMPVLLDCMAPEGHPDSGTGPPAEEAATDLPQPPMEPFCLNRHDGYVSGLFLDWSARRVGLKELWTLKWRTEFNTAGAWTKAGGVRPEYWPQWMRKFKDY